MDQYQNSIDMEKPSTIKRMPKLPTRDKRNENFLRYSDCQSLWAILNKQYTNPNYEWLVGLFFRYIQKKEDKPMLYLETASASTAVSMWNVPERARALDGCDCEDCNESRDYFDDCDDDEEDNEMNNENDQRVHLSNRTYQIANQHESKLRADFHLNNDEAPDSFDEFVARVQAGKMTFDKNIKTDRKFGYFGDMLRYITWRDPNVPADQAGFDAAWAKVLETRTAVNDDVAILEPKDALASVRAFEKATFH